MPEKSEAAMRAHGGGGNVDAAGNHRHAYSTAYEAQRQYPRYGELTGDVWHKELSASRHMLRVPPSWAVDLADLDAAESNGARVCVIRDLETGRTFWAMLATIRRLGFRVDRRAGEQIGLTLDHWRGTRREAEAATELEPTPEQERETLAVQGALW